MCDAPTHASLSLLHLLIPSRPFPIPSPISRATCCPLCPNRRSKLPKAANPSPLPLISGAGLGGARRRSRLDCPDRSCAGWRIRQRPEPEAEAMGRLFLMHLDGNAYSCKFCRTHLGLAADIISKSFHSKHGKAYLFNRVVNVTSGVKEDRLMMTGMHTVSDIFCVGCGSIVGWKYEAAHEKNQRYKEGKFILER
ncbi:protein yippee-like isoform X2 [Lolium rigidum]|uniref:protein yippee-like isoform X2 n=1 Tax=Lolium rigidum TaxID=89674 RepID=UPI001F5CB108|nr:protein yippee-like isoform X2 [Lolium rigidum]